MTAPTESVPIRERLGSICLLLLGSFSSEPATASIDRLPAKSKAILAYLASNPGAPVTRDRLADLCWSRSGPEQARQSLRQALLSLRSALADFPQATLHSQGEMVQLDGVTTDVQRLGTIAQSTALKDLSAAEQLYRGPFLDDLPDIGPPFEEWRLAERTRLHEIACRTLLQLGEAQLNAKKYSDAISTAQRAVALDPLREDLHRLLIKALAASGRRAEALREYDELSDLLRRELKVAPDAETRQLVEALREAPLPRVKDTEPPIPLAPRPTYQPGAHTSPLAPPPRKKRALWLYAALLLLALLPSLGWFYTTHPEWFGGEIKPLYVIAPVQALSSDAATVKLAETLTPRIIGGLGGVPTIRARLAGTFGTSEPDFRVEMTVEAVKDKVHAEGRVVNAKAGEIVATSRFDADQGELSDVQDLILGSVGRELTEKINQLAFPYPLDTPEKQKAFDLAREARDASNGGAPFEKIEERLQESLRLDPNNLANVAYYANSLVAEAINNAVGPREVELFGRVNDILKALPPRALRHRLLSYAACQLATHSGQYGSSIEICVRTQRILPWSSRVYKELGFAALESNDLSYALTYFKIADRLQKVGAVRWTWKIGEGLTQILLNNNIEALNALNIAILLNSSHSWPYLYLSLIQNRLGNKGEAIKNAIQFRNINPNVDIEQYIKALFPNAEIREGAMKPLLTNLANEMKAALALADLP
jgi:DNA-binding SARP family transcriptional activator